MSRTYTVSKATHLLFATLVLPGHEFKDTSVPQPDGTMLLTLSDEVAERLEAKRFPAEDDDALLDRVLRMASHGVN